MMNDENDINEFNTIEQLEEVTTSLGWNVRYRQLSKGNFKYRAIAKESNIGISLLREQLNLKMEAVGEGLPELISFLLPTKGNTLWCNGHTVDDNAFLALASDQQSHCISNGPTDTASILISQNILFELSSKLTLMSDKPLVKSSALIRASHEKNHWLRQMTDTILRSATENLNTEEMFFRYMEQITLLIGDSATDPGKVHSPRAAEKWRVMCRSQEYIEAHLNQPMQMAEICHYSSVSLSKLEKVFLSELQMTPLAYIKIRRLNKIRSSLLGTASLGKTISQLAMDHGFTHLGRFSAEYHALFGQLPHEDQKR